MKQNGSITVFAALAMMLIASFLFALLEAGRVHILEAYADMKSDLGIDSVAAEYQPGLWENYHLLCLDGAYGGDEFSIERVNQVLERRICQNLQTEGVTDNILGMRITRAEAERYQLLTDGDGQVFLHRIADYMKGNLLLEAADILYEKYKTAETLDNGQEMEDSIENAQNAILEAKEYPEDNGSSEDVAGGPTEEENAITTDEAAGSADEVKENPLEIVLELKENAILGMVVEDVTALSSRKLDAGSRLEQRVCQGGNAGESEKIAWYEKVLALEYLDHYYADYTGAPSEEHAVSYEMEYVLCGKTTDKANLEAVVDRLLLIREAANVIHIVEDADKRNEAKAIANALAGFTGNAVVIQLVQIGIIAAWGFIESIQDVRALLRGDKIALLKSKNQWTTDITNLVQSFQSTSKAKNCDNGLSYADYLKLLLWLLPEKELAYRMMDVMEHNIRCIPAYQNCRMDHMICRMEYATGFEADAFFSKLAVIGSGKPGSLKFSCRKSFSY